MNQMTENEVAYEEDIFHKNLLQLLSQSEYQNATEGLIVLMHSFMLEVGFIPNEVTSDVYSCMPDNWKSNGIFKIQYLHPNVSNALCWVTWIPLYGNLVTQGTVENQESEFTVHVTLPAATYIKSQENQLDQSSNHQNVFCHPEVLSRVFKDEFCYPLLSCLEDSANHKSSFGFSTLLVELKLLIMKHLPVEAVVSLSAVNKDFNYLANSVHLWKFLYDRDYGPKDSIPDPNMDRNWKELYKAEYLRRKKSRSRPLPMYHPSQFPYIYPAAPNFDEPSLFQYVDPVIQQAFPQLRSRFRPSNWLYPGNHYQCLRRFW